MVSLVREKALHRHHEKGAKLAALLLDSFEPVLFEKLRKEFLREVLCFLGIMALPAHKSVEGIPVALAEFVEGELGFLSLRSQHDGPLSGVERWVSRVIHGAARGFP